MIGKLTGIFAGSTEGGAILIDVNGVGYNVRTPLSTVELLRLGEGGGVSLFIHTAVREDALDLYGFPTEEDLSFFKQLMSVSGVGPKTALGILNAGDSLSLKRAIASGNSTSLTKIFGIGKKSAERLVLELRDKLDMGVSAGSEAGGNSDVIEALMALGYAAGESREATKKALRGKEAATTQELVALALRELSQSGERV